MSRSPRSIPDAYAVSVGVRRAPVAWAMVIALMLFSTCLAAAQAATEYGHIATSSTGLAGLSNNSTLFPAKQPASARPVAKQPGSATAKGTSPQDANRRALEQRAGKDAAKLSLKSVPEKAVVRIDGKPIGKTPLLISLAPGAYKIEIEGPRMELGQQQLNLDPNETREVQLTLSAAPRYPNRIELF